jgi:hypothetical protein
MKFVLLILLALPNIVWGAFVVGDLPFQWRE